MSSKKKWTRGKNKGKTFYHYERKYTPPAGANVTPISPALIAQVQANTSPQKDPASAFSPGAPILPTPGVTLKDGPRGWQFPIGYNIGSQPRSTEVNSFDTLRNLASLYDGFQIGEQVWFDLTSKLEPKIKPREEVLAAAGGDESVFADDIATLQAFFEYPDPDAGLDLKSWMRMAIKDQIEIDAVAIYIRPNRVGGVYALELIDGATMKPLIDERGRPPAPPYPAYQQFWYGAPLGWYSSDQILYVRETPRTDSIYGVSRVERLIMRINQALRKQNKDMARFTDGNMPEGVLEMPPNPDNEWTPAELLAYQEIWDALLAGNDMKRARLKVVEPGAKFTRIDDPDIMTPFDTFLLNTTAACLGLTMAEFGFTENVNKSSGDSQEAVVYRRAMRPMMNRYAQIFTMIIKKYFKEDRFIFTWAGYEEAEDLNTQATAYKTMISAGMMSPSTAAKLMKYPVEIEIPPYFTTATGPIFFEDVLDPKLRKAQQDAKLKGLQLANTDQAPGTPGDSGFQPGGDDKQKKPQASGAKSPSAENQSDLQKPAGGGDQEEDEPDPATHSRARQPINTDMLWQDDDPDVQATLKDFQSRGVEYWQWQCDGSQTCDLCIQNHMQIVRVGQPFKNGAICTPGHNHCGCRVVEVGTKEW